MVHPQSNFYEHSYYISHCLTKGNKYEQKAQRRVELYVGQPLDNRNSPQCPELDKRTVPGVGSGVVGGVRRNRAWISGWSAKERFSFFMILFRWRG